MSDAQAAVAAMQLDLVDPLSEARIAHAAAYDEALRSIEGLITPRWRGDGSHIYICYPIQSRRRDELLRHALSRRRDFAAQHLRNCADLPEFKEFYRDCPRARAASRELILSPTYPRYPRTEVERNIDLIRRFSSR